MSGYPIICQLGHVMYKRLPTHDIKWKFSATPPKAVLFQTSSVLENTKKMKYTLIGEIEDCFTNDM